MNIRFIIFLLSIFMVFVPCYGMQVANHHDNVTITDKIVKTYYKSTKTNNNDTGLIVSAIFWTGVGLGLLIRGIVKMVKKKANKRLVWGNILIGLGIILFCFAAGYWFSYLASGLLGGVIDSSFLAIIPIFLIPSIIALFFGIKLWKKGRKEEKEKLQKNNN